MQRQPWLLPQTACPAAGPGCRSAEEVEFRGGSEGEAHRMKRVTKHNGVKSNAGQDCNCEMEGVQKASPLDKTDCHVEM
eukprot:1158533-Pelagomonas_calceolata.AAC.19